MLTLTLALSLLAADTRRVEVEPGFELPKGSVEFDRLTLTPTRKTIESTREFAGSRSSYAAELEIGTRVTIVFGNLEHVKPYVHSVAGPFEVVPGDGPLKVVAKTATRTAVFVSSNADELTIGPRRILLPLPEGLVARDERDDDAKVSAPDGFWAVPVPTELERDRETKVTRIKNLLEGYTYVMPVSAAGFETAEVRLGPEATELSVQLTPIDPLIVKVVSATGDPVVGAKVVAREQPPKSGLLANVPITPGFERHEEVTDASGVAKVTNLYGDTVYDMYVDGGDAGRTLVQGVRAGLSTTVSLVRDAPLTVTIRNIPSSEGGAANRFSAQEQWSKKLGVMSLYHGPFDVTGDEASITLPAPLGDVVDFSGNAGGSWKRKLIVNARGREAVIDLSDPFEEVYVDDTFAPPRRTITLRFVTPDDGEVVPRKTSPFLAGTPADFTFAVARRGPNDEEKASRSYRSTKFKKSGRNQFSMVFPADEEVRFNFDHTTIDGYVIAGRPFERVFPDENDITVDIPLVPAVDYALDLSDFKDRKMGAARIPYASTDVVRSGNDADWIRLWNGKLRPDTIRVPAGQPTLLLINDDPAVIVKRLDGTGGPLNVEWDKLQRTTIQALGPDGEKINTRFDGFVIPDSGIASPVSVYHEHEQTGPEADRSDQVVMNMQSDDPVWGIVHGFDRNTQKVTKRVIQITPGEHHDVQLESGRVMWVDLLNPDGSDFRIGGRVYPHLYYTREDGIEIEVDSNYYEGRFVGVPESGPFRYGVYLEQYGYFETTLTPGTVEETGIIVELPPKTGEEVRLTPTTKTSSGQRKQNRDFMRERESRR